MTRLEMSIRLVLSESSRNGDVNGSHSRGGWKSEKRKIKRRYRKRKIEERRVKGTRGEDQGMDVFTLYPLFF